LMAAIGYTTVKTCWEILFEKGKSRNE